jgi:lipoyl-dependent peroxiredoxin
LLTQCHSERSEESLIISRSLAGTATARDGSLSSTSLPNDDPFGPKSELRLAKSRANRRQQQTKGDKAMATRTGSAVWEGTLKQGKGNMKLGSGAFEGPYSFSSRFEEGKGTNPEELIGAAEAGCFTMALSANLEKAGHPAKRVSTTATVKLEMVGGGPKITTIDLKTEAEVPGIDEAKFREQAELTKKTCPVSVALSGTQINLEAKLL